MHVPAARAKPSAEAPSVEDALAAIECLSRLSDLYEERRAQLARSVLLSEQQWAALEEIAAPDFMPSLFAKKRDSSPAAVSKILRQLVDKGLVVATVGKGDARQRKYALTAKGKRVVDRLRESRESAIREVWLSLDRAGIRAFTDFGRELIDKLSRYAAAESEKE